MTYKVSFIAHAQTIELRLQVGEQQKCFSLAPGKAPRPKTLEKIENWCRQHSDSDVAARILAAVHEGTQGKQSSVPQPPSKSDAKQVKAACTVVCDYSRQGETTVWACVITQPSGEVTRCCGLVPIGENGEAYAILRTHAYLYRLGCSGTILSDEKSTVERLSQWYPVAFIERTQPKHRPAHQLAHDFALLVAGKLTSHLADLQYLRKLFWEGSRLGDFVSIRGQGWKICLPFSVYEV